MRGLGSVLLAGAVGVLALVAAVDALRGGDTSSTARSKTPTTALVPGPSPPLGSFGGTLLYVDRRCRLHMLELPSLAPVEPARAVGCDSRLDTTGRLAAPNEAWQPGGDLLAGCIGNQLTVTSGDRTPILRRRGCAPAWKPDGSLTYVVDGSLRLSSRIRDRRLIVSQTDVSAAARRSGAWLGAPTLRSAAWIGSERVALLLTTNRPPGAEPSDLVWIFDHGRPVLPQPFIAPRLSTLTASPGGGFVGVRTGRGERAGLTLLDRDGRRLDLTFMDARAIAWSPDERWAVVATRASMLLFRTTGGDLRIRRLPIRATQLAWIG